MRWLAWTLALWVAVRIQAPQAPHKEQGLSRHLKFDVFYPGFEAVKIIPTLMEVEWLDVLQALHVEAESGSALLEYSMPKRKAKGVKNAAFFRGSATMLSVSCRKLFLSKLCEA